MVASGGRDDDVPATVLSVPAPPVGAGSPLDPVCDI
jgi:hypothetical protein